MTKGAVWLAGQLYLLVQNPKIQRAIGELIHAAEYDGQNRIILQLESGQRFNLIVTDERL